ncbi:MAG: hypothetical protein JOZ57_04755, partial [Abitibacteriaceae bacterium]|nr:hypothetical protein [Abditibacteriaceae bacterium]
MTRHFRYPKNTHRTHLWLAAPKDACFIISPGVAMKLSQNLRCAAIAVLCYAVSLMWLHPAQAQDKKIVWDGDTVAGGKGWLNPEKPANSFSPQTGEAHNGKVALGFHAEGSGFIGSGWNWFGWFPADAGTDVTPYHNLSFWVKINGQSKPQTVTVQLVSVGDNTKPTKAADLTAYNQ